MAYFNIVAQSSESTVVTEYKPDVYKRQVLPVEVLNYDDRMEYPQGVTPVMQDTEHPVLKGVAPEWPHFLGYNKIKAKPQAQLIATIGENDTFMAGM